MRLPSLYPQKSPFCCPNRDKGVSPDRLCVKLFFIFKAGISGTMLALRGREGFSHPWDPAARWGVAAGSSNLETGGIPDDVVVGSQYDNAVMNHDGDKVIVL
jgi:hypothetical protein